MKEMRSDDAHEQEERTWSLVYNAGVSRFFWMNEDRAATAKHGGDIDATHTWRLPGVRCHTCGATWSDVGHDYPSVDLSLLPGHRELEKPRPEPFLDLRACASGFALWCHAAPSCHLERPSAH